jgi:hypothetical protein
VSPEFIQRLYSALQTPNDLMAPALICLTGIIEKGMPHADKVILLDQLSVTQFLDPLWDAVVASASLNNNNNPTVSSASTLASSSETTASNLSGTGSGGGDLDMVDTLAKYINSVGMELTACFSHLTPSPPSASSLSSSSNNILASSASASALSLNSLSASSSSHLASQAQGGEAVINPNHLKPTILYHLSVLMPTAIKVLQNEYDDTSVLIFPFMDDFIALLRDLSKKPERMAGVLEACAASSSGPNRRMEPEEVPRFMERSMMTLLRVIVGKMKFDEEAVEEFGEGDEDEAEFIEFRKVCWIILLLYSFFFNFWFACVLFVCVG